MKRALRIAAVAAGWLAAAGVTGWCAMAIAWSPSGPSLLTAAGACAFACAVAWTAAGPVPRFIRHRAVRSAAVAAAWASVIAWFLLVPAPADGDWKPDVAQPASFRIDGDLVTVSGIRNFRYGASDEDIRPAWDERTYDLRALRTLDLFFSFWGPRLICHNFVSFGFERADGSMEQLAVSIEVRKRRGQEYSAIGGLFRQFPLAYVWADERDVVRVRTNFRGERVHRYRVESSTENLRILFERYAIDTVELARHPRWYNAVTQNCGIDILRTAWGSGVPTFPGPGLLLNGTWERQAWEDGRIAPELPWVATLDMADITPLAITASDEEFSRAIRSRDIVLEASRSLR